jgi:hypothetical protein
MNSNARVSDIPIFVTRITNRPRIAILISSPRLVRDSDAS